MPASQPFLPSDIAESEKDKQVLSLRAEVKSMRRNIVSLRRTIHELQAEAKARSETREVKVKVHSCSECFSLDTKTVKMTYKDAHRCVTCGHLWLTDGTNV